MTLENKLYQIKGEFDSLITPQVVREAELFHQRMSRIDEEDLNKSFTI